MQDTTPLTRYNVKITPMATEEEEGLTSGEVLLSAAAVVWSQRRMQRNRNRDSAETEDRVNSKGLGVKAF